MTDRWTRSFDKGDVSAVVALDMSAAFDLVDKDLFLQKLSAYKVVNSMINWVESYLSNRKQRVNIDGCLSEELDVQTGVPQGSILGPLFYVIFTSDLPKTIHDNNPGNNQCESNCGDCGFLTCYADDSTYTVSSADPNTLSEKISAKYSEISNYMQSNKLVLNSEKQS